jgi:hypothetical protein
MQAVENLSTEAEKMFLNLLENIDPGKADSTTNNP